jgi:hypothetical protein
MSDPITPASPAAPTEPVAAAPTPETPAPTPAAPESPWSDPKAAEAEITKLRRENANRRTSANTAVEDARKELAQSIGKALGLVKDDEPVDPAELTKQVGSSQAEAKQARVELAVFRNAATAGGDPAALLDSSSFLASLASVDPSDSAAVTAAIQSAITANPRLGAAPADPRAPAPNPAQGASAGVAPGLDAQIDEATKAGNIALAISLKQQRAALAAKS